MDPFTISLLIAGGSALISGIGDWMNREAAAKAAETSAAASAASAETVNAQIAQTNAAMTSSFNEFQNLMSPYAEAGTGALKAQQDLTGANGPEAQKAAVDAIANNPQLQEQMLQGENAMRQNAAATGGLRGGNFQGALAQFRPAMVNQAINQRYEQLSGLSNMGLGAASNLGAAGMNLSANIGQNNIMGAGLTGNANAAAAMAAGMPTGWENILPAAMSGLGTGLGTYAGLGGDFGLSGGGAPAPVPGTLGTGYNQAGWF
jgi:hypothetical protein